MSQRRRRWVVALVLVLALPLSLSACQRGAGGENGGENGDENGDEGNVIRIGMTAPLTGATAASGMALRQGAELATEEINAEGGIDLGGRQYTLRLSVEDSQSKPEVGVSAAERLITGERVHYLIGDALHSSVTMAIMDLAPEYQIPIVSCEPVSDAIAEKVRADPERYRYFWKMNYGSTAYADTVVGSGAR
jgi:branched-chain amino acid transport system substrate-binding protein